MKNKFRIKVCGMRDRNNIRELLALNPDYIGFIFYSKSKRFMDRSIDGIDFQNTKKTGVFVDESLSKVRDTAKRYQLDVLQLHGNETPQYCLELKEEGYEIIKAFSVDEEFDFKQSFPYLKVTDLFLFDAKGKQPGGNGITFNWKKLEEYQYPQPFLLSGGISMNHLEELKIFSHPEYVGIDINSGFERSPGLKNIPEIKSFIKEIKI